MEPDINKFRLLIPTGKGNVDIKEYVDADRAMSSMVSEATKYGGFDKFKADGGALLGPGQEATGNISTVEGATISPIAEARIKRHEDFLRENGIVMPPPVYAPGTRVIELGDENFRISRQEWEKNPEITGALEEVVKTVKAESRTDYIVPLAGMQMDDYGVIHNKAFPSGKMPLEARGLEQLVGSLPHLFPRGLSLMRALSPVDRAYVFNKQIAKDPEEKIRFRARLNTVTGEHSSYAIVSPKYTPINIDYVAAELKTAFASGLANKEMRGEVIYDAPNVALKVNAFLHADRVIDLAAGDVFKVGISAKTSDNGSGGIVVDLEVIRNLCLNLIILGTAKSNLLNKRHRGASDDIGFKIEMALQNSQVVLNQFASEWGLMRETKVETVFKTKDVPEIMAIIGEQLDTGFKADVNADLLMASWSKEPGDTMADFLNAVTRLHENDFFNELRREKVERQAGEMLTKYAKMAA